ncbi:MAG: type VI secretion system baseplate subunit TssK [Deltaproteobacteria bacterium]|jgi:type VI secretion system protein ImpJ|nr:type VI secretion system baseplate subunit TssK [Deltaproteobacteria bacterium]
MLPEKVVWSEGMMLRPQHFQQQDRYLAAQIQRRGLLLSHYPWGLSEFEIDQQYLSLGKLVLSRAAGLLPDGTLFETGRGRELLSLDIPSGLSNQLIYLVLPLSPEGSSETSPEGEAGLATKYLSHPLEVYDSNIGQTRNFTIMCGALALRLVLESELKLEGCLAMPIAKLVESKADRSLVLDQAFQPTYLRLSACDLFSGYLREIIGLLAHRGSQLSLKVAGAGPSGAAEIADFLLLQTINRLEPFFKHLEKAVNVHPEEFYLNLLVLIGELSTFAESAKRPKESPAYDHLRQEAVLTALMEQARYLLSMVLEQHSVELPLQKRKYDILVATIHDRSLLTTATFVVSAQADLAQETLRSSLPKQLKIGPVERIRQLINLHLPGINLRPLPVAPRQIPFHADKTYFRLEITSEELSQLELSGGFAFFVSGTFPGLKLRFWAIKE